MAIEIISRAEARARGLKRFFTGIPCKRSHISERFSGDAKCIECANLLLRRQYAENPVKFRTKVNKQYAANPAKGRERSRKWLSDNYEKARTLRLERYAADPEKFRAKLKKSRAANPERTKALRRLHENRRRAQKLESVGSHTYEQILDLFKKQRGHCANCLCSIKCGYHCDHIVPLARGGSDYITNIQLLCATCNHKKHAKDPFLWAMENGRLL